MPVRLTIQASSTPMRSAIGPFGTTSGGTWWPSPRIRAVRAGARMLPLRVASRAIVARSGGSEALRMGQLLRRGLHPAVGHDALAQAGEHLAGPDLDEATPPCRVHGQHGLAPTDGARQDAGQLGADVLERLRRRRGEHRESALVQLGLVEGGAERCYGRFHARGVERAGDVERQHAAAVLTGGLLSLRELVAR